MATFFQTWNIPGSSKFDYVCFDAKNRKEATEKVEEWLNHKESECELTSDIRNGYSGSLVSLTESKKWLYQSGSPILSEEHGREQWDQFNSKNSPC